MGKFQCSSCVSAVCVCERGYIPVGTVHTWQVKQRYQQKVFEKERKINFHKFVSWLLHTLRYVWELVNSLPAQRVTHKEMESVVPFEKPSCRQATSTLVILSTDVALQTTRWVGGVGECPTCLPQVTTSLSCSYDNMLFVHVTCSSNLGICFSCTAVQACYCKL